jgi:hypothetical protein
MKLICFLEQITSLDSEQSARVIRNKATNVVGLRTYISQPLYRITILCTAPASVATH